MTEKKGRNYKDVIREKPLVEASIYDNVPTDKNFQVEPAGDQIPCLFASIHTKSDHRPNGYGEKSLFHMNWLANSHIPSLQKQMLDDRKAEGGDVEGIEDGTYNP